LIKLFVEIVAGLIDEIGIVEVINQKLGVDNREKITAGQAIKPTFRRYLYIFMYVYIFKETDTKNLLSRTQGQ
jgi:hypothetical protein